MEMEGLFWVFFFGFENSGKPANGPQPRKVLWSIIFCLLPAPSVCADQNKHNIGAVSHRLLLFPDRNIKKKKKEKSSFCLTEVDFWLICTVLHLLCWWYCWILCVHIRGFDVINQNNYNFSVSILWKKNKKKNNSFQGLCLITSSAASDSGQEPKGLSLNCFLLFLLFFYVYQGINPKRYEPNLHYPVASLLFYSSVGIKYSNMSITTLEMPQIIVFFLLWFASPLLFFYFW